MVLSITLTLFPTYPFWFITAPLPFTTTGEFPRIPSLSESEFPASTTSKHPSSSESKSLWSGIPSESVSK